MSFFKPKLWAYYLPLRGIGIYRVVLMVQLNHPVIHDPRKIKLFPVWYCELKLIYDNNVYWQSSTMITDNLKVSKSKEGESALAEEKDVGQGKCSLVVL